MLVRARLAGIYLERVLKKCSMTLLFTIIFLSKMLIARLKILPKVFFRDIVGVVK